MRIEVSRFRGASAAGLLAAAVLSGCGGEGGADAPAEGIPEAAGRVINVETLRVVPGPFTETIRITGVLRADRDVTIAAEEMGVVRELLVARGARVREGDPVLRIEDRALTAQVEQARAAARLAEESWARRRRLWEEDRVGSELGYLEARYASEQAAAAHASLEARLERSTIRAPFDGVLEDRFVEVGAMVAPGTPVARIVSLAPVRVEGGVPERFAADVEPGAPVRVTLDIFPGETFPARADFVGSAVDPSNRTFPIEVRIPNVDGRLKPEMVANLDVVRRSLEGVLVVPREAMVRIEDGFVAFVVEDGPSGPVAAVRPVRLGASSGNIVVVEEGLVPGDRIVVVGQQELADGDRVQVIAEQAEEEL